MQSQFPLIVGSLTINLSLHKHTHIRQMLTVYMYLNDVPAGGGTRFPQLNLTVTPKQGRVVIWPSVYNHNTTQEDPRTEHEALPVEEGIKYGTYVQYIYHACIHSRCPSSCAWRAVACYVPTQPSLILPFETGANAWIHQRDYKSVHTAGCV